MTVGDGILGDRLRDRRRVVLDLHLRVGLRLRDVEALGRLAGTVAGLAPILALDLVPGVALDDVIAELRLDERRDLARLERGDGMTIMPRGKTPSSPPCSFELSSLYFFARSAKFAAVTCARTDSALRRMESFAAGDAPFGTRKRMWRAAKRPLAPAS